MQKILVEKEFFNIGDTLECGQAFSFVANDDGSYIVLSQNKICKLQYEGNFVAILSDDTQYFATYFDLNTNYGNIVKNVVNFNLPYLTSAAKYGKGIRILRQDSVECLFHFIISQNNNIARIKKIIFKLSETLGEKVEFLGDTYYFFPSVKKLAAMDVDFYKSCGLGYRASYVLLAAQQILQGALDGANTLTDAQLLKQLTALKGVGHKVANCVMLFGYYRTRSFPVDVWVEKIYLQNLGGALQDRQKTSQELSSKFGDLSGFVQQYLFYYKRQGN